MFRKSLLTAIVLLLALVMALPAAAGPGKPNFSPAIYADGKAWGTKGLAALPAPNANNVQSFDKLFVITNGADGQLPVSEAGPGNPAYNGGRWFTHTVTWTLENPPLVTSYAELLYHESEGHLTIEEGSPDGGPPDYFECPLLPVK